MKNITLIVILFLTSCQQEENKSKNETNLNYQKVDVLKWKKEVLSIDSMFLDGVLPLKTSHTALLRYLGKPNNTFIQNIANGTNLDVFDAQNNTQTDKYLAFNNIVFETRNNLAIFKVDTFEENDRSIHIPGLILNRYTSVKQVQNLFPESGQLLIGHYDNCCIMVNEGPANTVHKVWFFVFKLGHLSKLILQNYSPLE